MTYLKLNSWQESKRSTLSPEGRKALKTWLWGDYMLYNHFKDKFDEKVRNMDNMELEHDLKILRLRNNQIETDCIKV